MKIKAGKMIQRLLWVESRPLQVKNMVVLLFPPQNFLFKYENHFGEIITIINAVGFAWAVCAYENDSLVDENRKRKKYLLYDKKERDETEMCR